VTAIDVVVPMAGEGARFARAGWPTWKPLIDVGGRSMIERVLDGLRLPGARCILLVRADRRTEIGHCSSPIATRSSTSIWASSSPTPGAAVSTVRS
jgi:CTP:molybdopterin cytidylyltransferase MocA